MFRKAYPWLSEYVTFFAPEDPPGGGGGGGDDPPKNDDPPGDDPPPDFDWKAEAEKWKGLARKHEDAAKRNADAAKKLKEIEDAGKSELEKAQAALEEHKGKAAEATRELLKLRVALRKGLTETQARRLVGESEEELEKDADELIASFKADDGDGEANNGNGSGRPQERLRPGTRPTSQAAPDAKKIVDELMATRVF